MELGMMLQGNFLIRYRMMGASLLTLASIFAAQCASAQTVIYQDDFESGTSGWSQNITENAPMIGTNFLGRFGRSTPQVTRTFTLPAGATSLDIEFDLLRFDSWDFFGPGNDDGFSVLIDGTPLFSTTASFGTFPYLDFPGGQGARSGTTGNVDWAHVPINPAAGSAPANLDFRNLGSFDFDQIHRFTITVNNPGATVDLTLLFDSDQSIGDESAGYDNFLVTAVAPPPIDAVNDDFTATPFLAGDNTPNIFSNDDFDGSVPDISTVDVNVINDGGLGVGVNSDGTISIPAGTPAGPYTLTYQICEAGSTTNCDTATVDIVVDAPIITVPTISCDGFTVAPLSFTGATLSSGTNLQPGAVYDYSSVAPGIDAQVEILNFANGGSISNIDNDAGLSGYLQPEFVPNPAGGGYATFRVSFINAATGLPEPLGFSATQIDIDGDSQTLREFVEFDTSLSQFTVDASTELLINASGPTSGSFSRFESTTSQTAPGIDPTAEANVARAIYTNATSYDFVYGTLGAGASTRLASVGFDCPIIPNPVNAIPNMEADLVTVKALAAGTSATPSVGDVVTYEITVTNNGPDLATNVNLSDNLPAGLTATANNGTVTDGTFASGAWTIPALPSGDTATLTLEGTVDADQGNTVITNTLAGPATSDVDDPTTAGDDLTESITIPQPVADLVTVKALAASSSATPAVGDTVTYEITVTNNGPDVTTNVTLSDSLPAGLTATANNETVTAGTFTSGTWDIPILLNGATETLTLEGTVDAGEEGNTITNTLAGPAASDADDPSTTGDDLDEAVTVVQPSFSMVKVASSTGPFTLGDVITYTYTVTNDGNTVIRDVAINDTHNGSDPAPTPGNETLLADNGTAGDSTDATPDGSWDVLAPGDVITFTGTYTVTAADAANL